ncbi:MAG: DNA-binding protein [Thermoprotei archaeon]
MSSGLSKVVDIGRKHVDDYVFEIIVSFQEGVDEVVIRGYGENISKAVDVYNELHDRLGESIELVNVEIGSEKRGGRTRSYIAIRVRRKY